MGFERVNLGSLYFNDGPITPRQGTEYPYTRDAVCGPIFGDTIAGKALTWIKPTGMDLLVSDRVILRKAVWTELNRHGFVSGKVVRIDGSFYLCRLLSVGNKAGVPNEWDTILDIVGEDDSVLHWTESAFWGSDISWDDMGNTSFRPYRSRKSARHWDDDLLTTVRGEIGFRPVLEPIHDIRTAGKYVELDEHIFYLTQFRMIAADHNCAHDGLFLQLFPVNNTLYQGIPSDGSILPMYMLISEGQPVCQNRMELPTYKKGTKIVLTDEYYGESFLLPWQISFGVATTSAPVLWADEPVELK